MHQPKKRTLLRIYCTCFGTLFYFLLHMIVQLNVITISYALFGTIKKIYIYRVKKASIHTIMRFARKIVFLLLLHSPVLKAQEVYSPKDFKAVDSFAAGVTFQGDYIDLARNLANPFPEDIFKVRAIFKWICNNIAYDYRFINSGKELQVPDCAGEFDCIETMRAWENNYIKKILRTKKATADGYAKLFNRLCEIAHIQCEVIPGYLRTKPYQIGNKISASHTWNAVFLDTSWYFLDVTLAAGYCIENEETDKLVKFVKDYSEYYWLSSFEQMARNHFPKNPYWGAQHNMTLENFFNNPHYYSIEVMDNISDECPATGILTVKQNDSIHFSFDYKKDIRFIQVNSNTFRNPSLWTTINVTKRKTKIVRDEWAEKKQVYIPFQKAGWHYEFDYVAKDMSLYYIELVFDYKKAIRYKVTVTK